MKDMTIMEMVNAAEEARGINDEGYVTNQMLRERLAEIGIIAGKKVNRTALIERLKDAAYQEMIAENQDDAEPDYDSNTEEEVEMKKLTDEEAYELINRGLKNLTDNEIEMLRNQAYITKCDPDNLAKIRKIMGEDVNDSCEEDEMKNDEDNMDEILDKIVRMASNNHVRNQISRHMILSAVTETVYGKRLVEYVDKQRVENYSADSMEYQYAEKFVEHLLNNNCIAPFVDMRGAVSTKSFRINAKAMVNHTAKAVLTYYRDVHRTVTVDGVAKKKTEREFLNVDTDKKEFTVRGKKFNMTDDNCKLIDELYRIR